MFTPLHDSSELG